MQNFIRTSLYLLLVLVTSQPCYAATHNDGVGGGDIKWMAISIFIAFVLLTLFITWRASRKTGSAAEFYAADGSLTGFQNGLAISGDWMSAATFLGMSGLVFTFGIDGIYYAIGAAAAWPIIVFLLADRLRNLGQYTFADAVAYRLENKPIRVLSSISSLVVILLYLIAQMVGAGALIQLLFGLPYLTAVIIVGLLMTVYVSFGGMVATSWIQIIKAVILLIGGTILLFLSLSQVGFSFSNLLESVRDISPLGEAALTPGNLITSPIAAISLGLAFIFGPAGLPHILMRFFTVPDHSEARKSVAYAAVFIGYFQVVVFVIGLTAIVLLTRDASYFDPETGLLGGGNMAALNLAEKVGGEFFFGVVAAVTFATILAVVSGLTLAAAATMSHDLYANVIKQGEVSEKDEIRISRLSTIGIGVISIFLGVIFQKQNVAYMATLSLAVAASVNFIILFLSLYWKGLTTRGAVWGGYIGLFTAIGLVVLSKAVWVDVLGNSQAIYPYAHPTLFSLPATLIVAIIISNLDQSERGWRERGAFQDQEIKSEFG